MEKFDTGGSSREKTFFDFEASAVAGGMELISQMAAL